VTVALVERDPVLVACAREALQRQSNAAFAHRVVPMEADIADPATVSGPIGDEVLANPPFHEEGFARASPAPARAEAHTLGKEGLELWVKVAAKLLKPAGRLTMIFRADALSKLLAAVGRQFGGLDVLPVHPRAMLPAHRLIISGRKGSRAPLQLLPPLVLHGEQGNAFRPEIDAVLRNGAGLDEVHPTWRNRR
jgi:tRNA1(Val) A37 N6-methylase TrmN6